MAGGENVYGDADQPYIEASKETIVVRAPDVVLEFHAGEKLSEEDKAALVADWDKFPALPAVKSGRVHIVTEDYALLPGPRVTQLARLLAGLLHPEAKLPEP